MDMFIKEDAQNPSKIVEQGRYFAMVQDGTDRRFAALERLMPRLVFFSEEPAFYVTELMPVQFRQIATLLTDFSGAAKAPLTFKEAESLLSLVLTELATWHQFTDPLFVAENAATPKKEA